MSALTPFKFNDRAKSYKTWIEATIGIYKDMRGLKDDAETAFNTLTTSINGLDTRVTDLEDAPSGGGPLYFGSGTMANISNNQQIPNTAYYQRDYFVGTKEISSIVVECITASTTTFDFGIYDNAGTKIAGITTPLVLVQGLNTITFTTPVTIGDADYWIGVAGSAAGSSEIGFMTSKLNNTKVGRTVAASPTVGASLPAGTSSSARLWYILK